MSEYLQYGLEERENEVGRLYADVPRWLWERVSERRNFNAVMGRLKRRKIEAVSVQANGDAARLLINDENIGQAAAKTNQLFWVTNVLSMLEEAASPRRHVQTVRAELGVMPNRITGELSGTIDIKARGHGTADDALKAMDALATRLGTNGRTEADIDLDEGEFRLQVGRMAYAFQPHEYFPDGTGRLQLRSEYMTSHEAQLICLAGAVAVTRTDVLV